MANQLYVIQIGLFSESHGSFSSTTNSMDPLKIVDISVVSSHATFIIVTIFSKICGMLKSTRNTTDDVFKSTRHASLSCEVVSSIPLLSPCRNDANYVGTNDGNAPYT